MKIGGEEREDAGLLAFSRSQVTMAMGGNEIVYLKNDFTLWTITMETLGEVERVSDRKIMQ